MRPRRSQQAWATPGERARLPAQGLSKAGPGSAGSFVRPGAVWRTHSPPCLPLGPRRLLRGPPSGWGWEQARPRPHAVCGVGVQEHSPVHYPTDDGSGQGPLYSLDNNHAHFILVEPGPPGKGDGLTELRLRLEKHISEQRTGYGGEAWGGGCGGGVPGAQRVGRAGRATGGQGRAFRAEGTEHAWVRRPGWDGRLPAGWQVHS